MFDSMWVVWFGLTVILIILEFATAGIFPIFFAAGVIVSGALSFFTDNIPLQAAVGVLVSFILVVFVRPILQRTMNINQEVRPSTIHALIDVEGIVTKTITDTEFGLVKVNGETWTAKTMDGDCLEEGERIIVKGISGVKLEVIPVKPVRKKRTHKKEE